HDIKAAHSGHESDICEHMDRLYELAGKSRHVTEMGVRTGSSTIAFLWAKPDKLISYDIHPIPQILSDLAREVATEFVPVQANVLEVEIEETDLLFLDTLHTYDQLKLELATHSGKVRKWIVMHDTASYGTHGEVPGTVGLWPAIHQFLLDEDTRFRIIEHRNNNNGLTVLERY
ncbi:MAG: class I SAM-dependent methyltransferase, partial [bacterium]|nr:class I SAM-dependent methyltransferase [bacterium]